MLRSALVLSAPVSKSICVRALSAAIAFFKGKSNITRRSNRFALISVATVIVFLTLAFSLVLHGDKSEAAVVVTQPKMEQPALMPTLEGDKAREYLQQGLSDSLGEAISKARYKVRAVEQKTTKTANLQFEAENPRNGYRATFDTDGTTELSGGKNKRWQTSLRLLKFGRGTNLKTVETGKWEASENRTENKRDSIVEWFENKSSGLEHGFTIAAKPEAGANGTQELRVAMKIGGIRREI